MSDQPVFVSTDNRKWTIPGAIPYPPAGGGAPVIPANAGVKVLDDSNNWQGEHDGTTGGKATGQTKFLGPDKGRWFQNKFEQNAGFRWHNMFIKDTTPNHYCYKLGVSFNDPSLIGCLELDFTHVIAKNMVVYACIQATSWNKCWEYTTTPSGKCHWNKSNISVNPINWPANTKQLIELYSHRDDKGNVTYDGVVFNGTYTPFQNASALSMLNQNWTVGDLLINFQLGGRGSAGTLEATALNLQVYYWKA